MAEPSENDQFWNRVQELFAAGLELPSGDWIAYLERATDDPETRREVLSLLQSAAEPGKVDRVWEYLGNPGAESGPDPLVRLRPALAGRYEIERELGRGGMAIVYLARDLRHERRVALKLFKPELTVRLGTRRFLREIETSARLSHPHILPLFDSGEADGLYYFVMPYVDGETLRERLSRESQIPLPEAVALARDVAAALDHAHRGGVVHRDIKPENILCSGGRALVGDFGIARAVDVAAGDRITETGMAIGTPAYMSPEQAAGHVAEPRSDIYSLGCVVYEMLGGQPPFTGPTPQAVLARHALDPVPSLRTLRPGVPVRIQQVIERALSKVPADRYATAAEFGEALQQALVAPAPTGTRARWARWAGAGVGLLAVIGLLGRGYFARGGGSASLVVLPVRNLTGDTTQPHLQAGVHDGLIGELAGIGALRVISRTSAMHYAGGSHTVGEIARDLHVGWVIEPAIQREGDSIRLQLRLIQAVPEERQRWSATYDRPVTQLLTLYGDVARTVARQLNASLTPGEEARLAQTRPVNPRTYEAYLRGMFYLGQQTAEGIANGMASLRAAVEADPADPLAYAGLALGYSVLGHGPSPPPEAFARARAAALRAIQIDSNRAEGHAALAQIRLYAKPEWDWEGAGRAFERALALNPSLAETRIHYGWYQMLMGRPGEAVAQMRKARDTDPLSPLLAAWLGHLLWAYGRYDEAMVHAQSSLELSPEFPVGLYVMGLIYTSQGRFDEAFEVHRRAGKASPAWRWGLGHAYAVAGRRSEAEQVVAGLEGESVAWNSWGIAEIYTALGDRDAAMRWLETAYEQGHSYIPWLVKNPNFNALHSDPRFEALRLRLKVPA